MNIDDKLENKINQLTEEIKILSENLSSSSSTTNHRIIAVEKLMWKIERKLVDQEKFLKLLSSNELIDRLVTMKYEQSKIKPFHLQSEEYQRSSAEAMYDDEDD
ncbi:hypothetical protein P4H27_07470 [Paenibacillus taichungensis]|uniref:hypothetical protein n=1 Tax=Paenibacillus taichungensis TaxID=484184 RepID=UPI002DBF136C|nr:hypothetical protein [Paenibacillus taichungensis]MEC0106776.1 hypothetical protein [Paenibacillus taichungensis]MEC0195294.1 hypothetical protein [Paenibacillus taichungensis]